MEERDISNDLQIGFERDHQKADHILVLNTIIDQSKACKNNLYLAFIDLKQAYDRVNRSLLLEKMIELKIPAKIIRILLDQFSKVKYCVLTPHGRSRFFESDQGLKQGDPASPREFNFFFMGVLTIFADTCDPPYIQGTGINALLFADDLVILSRSFPGLQESLDRLHDFGTEQLLTVNIHKTKVMLIASDNTKTSDLPHLEYNSNPLEWVEGFNYLGVYLNQKGLLQPKEAPIWAKASKAQFKLACMTRSLSFDTKLWLHQVMVDPILFHGVEYGLAKEGDRKLAIKGSTPLIKTKG